MKKSAGILLYRYYSDELQFLLVHPGGPFWKNKDAGSWSIPKGEFTDESPLDAAFREFYEETGIKLSSHKVIALTPLKLKSSKLIYAFAKEGEFDPTALQSNSCLVEWPPKSGKQIEIPEVNKVAWFNFKNAQIKINSTQFALIEEFLSRQI